MQHDESIRTLLEHLFWADKKVLEAVLKAGSSDPSNEMLARAEQELAHLLGAEEVWFARIHGREARTAVWPEERGEALTRLMKEIHRGFRAMLENPNVDELSKSVHYTNSAGQRFSNSLGEILTHLALHGQYHRGKINHLLRSSGAKPAPCDFIAFVRGVPAATRNDG